MFHPIIQIHTKTKKPKNPICRDPGFYGRERVTGSSRLLMRSAWRFERLSRNPSLLREEVLTQHARQPVVIDEIQTIPALLGEVQWLMVNHKVEFVLCGSSARKVKRSGAQLLGGRALRFELYPLVSNEIPDFDLLTALNNGLLPRHYVSKCPLKLIQAYVGDYLKEEIAAEAISRNIHAFSMLQFPMSESSEGF